MRIFGSASLARFKTWIRPRRRLPEPTTGAFHDHTIPCRHPGGAPFGVCTCAERMGNDFYFLPADRCLWDSK